MGLARTISTWPMPVIMGMLLGLVFIFIVMFVPGGIVAGLARWRGAGRLNPKRAGVAAAEVPTVTVVPGSSDDPAVEKAV